MLNHLKHELKNLLFLLKKIFYGMICCTNAKEVEIIKNYIFDLKYTQKLQLGK